jgi:homoaconitase/3-isopropylmalate dehydratase large subunit
MTETIEGGWVRFSFGREPGMGHSVRQALGFEEEDGMTLLYVDHQLLHEITAAQAFEGLRQTHRPVWRASANLAVCDHNVPTTDRRA